MKKVIRQLEFIVNEIAVAVVDSESLSINEIESYIQNLSVIYKVNIEDVETRFISKTEKEPLSFGETFIAVTGKLCFHNDFWNAEIIEGFSFIDSINPYTVEGFDKITEYINENKVDELVKFN